MNSNRIRIAIGTIVTTAALAFTSGCAVSRGQESVAPISTMPRSPPR